MELCYNKDVYTYSARILKDTANCYNQIYDGIEFYKGSIYRYTETNLWFIAEFKADFDMALRKIGRGKWTGRLDDCKFKDFRYFGRPQQIIIADIMGVEENELTSLGFYDIPRFKSYAYYLMCKVLNGG